VEIPPIPELEAAGEDAVIDALEAQAASEVSEVLAAIKAGERSNDQRFDDATDSEYWFCICFQTREQKEEFLNLVGWTEIGDKYLDGMKVAKAMGLKLTSRIPELPRLRIDRALRTLTRS
jgi:hypothetical protein